MTSRGASARTVYVEGRGAETLGALVKAARSGEVIGLAGGYRVFGESRQQIMSAVRALKGKGAVLLDIETEERSDRDGDEMLDRALRRIHGELSLGSPEEAAARGSLGATATHKAIWATRMPKREARKIWFDKTISTADAVRRMGPGWSKPTALREFGPSKRKYGPTRTDE